MKISFDASVYPRQIKLLDEKDFVLKSTELRHDEDIDKKLKDTLTKITMKDNSFRAVRELAFINKAIDTFSPRIITITTKD